MTQNSKTPWWRKFFNEDFSAFLLDRENDPSLGPTADFIISALNLKAGDTIFDQCCGTGAVSRALAAKKIHVTGIDQAAHYIERALHIAKKDGLLNVFFEAADAFDYVTSYKCDAAINWYSSFGYLEDDHQNIKMMQRVFESLKPGGRFAIEYMNLPNLLDNFDPIYTRKPKINGQEVIVKKYTNIDQERGMVSSKWIYQFPDGTQKKSSGELRLYMPEDIAAMMEQSGFENIKLHGGFNGESCDASQQRCIAIGRAPS